MSIYRFDPRQLRGRQRRLDYVRRRPFVVRLIEARRERRGSMGMRSDTARTDWNPAGTVIHQIQAL
jgi:hypothetical protein